MNRLDDSPKASTAAGTRSPGGVDTSSHEPPAAGDKETLKKLVTSYSTNVKNYAKWFEINQVFKNEDSYTTYNVVYRFLPKDLNESVKELNVLKRFRDFKELYLTMSHYHMSLHRKDKFPEFPVRAKYFGRFDDKIIEERKQCSLRLLQFIGSQGHLYRHEKFIEFFTDATFKDFALANDANILKPVSLEPRPVLAVSAPKATGELSPIHASASNSQIKEAGLLGIDFKRSSSNLSSQPNSLNDWIFSDFNLNTNDFNKDLALISGNLFDLNFSYKIVRTLSSNCVIVQNRHPGITPKSKSTESDEFVLKCLNKSSNPNLENKCIVPMPNQVPYMCELVKYYESETTIFLLLEYVRNGKLAAHLTSFFETSSSTGVAEPGASNARPDSSESSDKGVRRTSTSSFKHKYNNSVSGLPSFDSKLTNTAVKRLSLERNPTDSSDKPKPDDAAAANFLQVKQPAQLVEVNIASAATPDQKKNEKLSNSSTSLSLSSSDSSLNESTEPKTGAAARDEISIVISPEVEEDPQKTVELLNINKSKASPGAAAPTRPALERPHSNMETYEKSPASVSLAYQNRNSYTAAAPSSGLSSAGSSSSSLANKFAWPLTVFNGPLKIFNSGDKKSSGSLNKENASRSNEQIVPRALFKNRSSFSKTEGVVDADPVIYDIKLNKYLTQVRTWLAQLLIAIDNLHRLGMECRNLCLDNLLLDKNNNLKLTYFSKWTLIDEHLNKDAVKCHYTAPELTGLVNQPVGKACDVWSFGVIAYELLTTKKFSDLNSPSQFYVNNIFFPEEFDCQPARELVKSILQLNPAGRPTLASIRRDRFFSVIDWVYMENSFWIAS